MGFLQSEYNKLPTAEDVNKTLSVALEKVESTILTTLEDSFEKVMEQISQLKVEVEDLKGNKENIRLELTLYISVIF